jgi:DNA polymerase elongation subunit (family B)
MWCIDAQTQGPVCLTVVGHPSEAYLELPTMARGMVVDWGASSGIGKCIKDMLKLCLSAGMDPNNPLNSIEFVKQWRMIGYHEEPAHYIHVKQEHRHELDATIKSRNSDLASHFMGAVPVWRETEIDPVTKMFIRRGWNRSGWFKLPATNRMLMRDTFMYDPNVFTVECGKPMIWVDPMSKTRPTTHIYIHADDIEHVEILNVPRGLSANPVIGYIDIETVKGTLKGFPVAHLPSDIVYLCSFVIATAGSSNGGKNLHDVKRMCLCVGYPDPVAMENIYRDAGHRIEVVTCDDEFELYVKLAQLIVMENPDVISGFNIHRFDLKYIEDRLALMGASFGNISRLPGKTSQLDLLRGPRGARYTNIKCPGRIVIDMLIYLIKTTSRQEVSSFSLKNVSKYYLKNIDLEKIDLDYTEQFKMYLKYLLGYPEGPTDLAKLVEYCVQDSAILHALFDHRGVWNTLMQDSNIRGMTIQSAAVAGQVECSAPYLYRRVKMRDTCMEVNPNVTKYKFEGGYVHLTRPGLHKGMVIGDFSSLYPSIMIEGNKCWTTRVLEERTLEFVNQHPPSDYRITNVDYGIPSTAMKIDTWTENAAVTGADGANTGCSGAETYEEDAIFDAPNPFSEGQIYNNHEHLEEYIEGVTGEDGRDENSDPGDLSDYDSELEAGDIDSGPIRPYTKPMMQNILPNENLPVTYHGVDKMPQNANVTPQQSNAVSRTNGPQNDHADPIIAKHIAQTVRKAKKMMAQREDIEMRSINVMYVSANVRRGIIPEAAQELLNERAKIRDELMPKYEKMYKASEAAGEMETYRHYLQVYDDLDKQQAAIKVATNSLYGIMGAIAPYADPFIGMTTTADGRNYIKKSTDLIINDAPNERRHVYSDTDSSMIIDDTFGKLDLTCLNRKITINLHELSELSQFASSLEGICAKELENETTIQLIAIITECIATVNDTLKLWSTERTALEKGLVHPIVKDKCVKMCAIPDNAGIYGAPMEFAFEAFVVVGMWFKKKFYICRTMDAKGNVKLKQRGVMLRRGDYPLVIKKMYGDACFGLLDGMSFKEVMLGIAGHAKNILLGPPLLFDDCCISSDYKALADYKSTACKMTVLAHKAEQMGVPVAEYSRVDIVTINPWRAGNVTTNATDIDIDNASTMDVQLAGSSMILERGGKSEHLATREMYRVLNAEPDRDYYLSVSFTHLDTLLACAASSMGNTGTITYYAPDFETRITVPGIKCPRCAAQLSHHLGGTGENSAFYASIQNYMIYYGCIPCTGFAPTGSISLLTAAAYTWKYDRPMESFKKIYLAYLTMYSQRPIADVRKAAIDFFYRTIHEVYA